eukprot:1412692-Prymnesium_polylepis.2
MAAAASVLHGDWRTCGGVQGSGQGRGPGRSVEGHALSQGFAVGPRLCGRATALRQGHGFATGPRLCDRASGWREERRGTPSGAP